MKFTSSARDSIYQKAVRENKTLKAQVLAVLRQKPQTSFELEDGLNRLHQSVSSTLTRLHDDGLIEIEDQTLNQYGNWVNLYAVRKSVR